MDETERYEVVVVGGGPAGLSTALYTTRLSHSTAVVDRGGGRAAMMLETHNVIGIEESVSGAEFLQTAWTQLESYGADLYRDLVTDVERTDDGFVVTVGEDRTLLADRVVLATGFSDVKPDPPLPRTGKGLHFCLHCDAYMFVDEPVYVMGHGDSAAHVAMIMLNVTDDVDLLLREADPTWSEETERLLAGHPVDVIETEVTGVNIGDDGWLESFEFADGAERSYRGGFAMYGSEYRNELARSLGCEVAPDGTVPVDEVGRTSEPGVYAVGDLTEGHKQIPVAIGEGAEAGIDIHYDLREFPRSLEELSADGPVDSEEVPGIAPSVARAAREFRADD